MNRIHCNIDGKQIEVPEKTSILEAASQAGISIPHLCYLKGCPAAGSCRMCIVSVEGKKAFAAACDTEAADGMVIRTDTEELERARKINLDLICSDHRQDCARCRRFPECELHALCREYGIDDRENMFNRPEETEQCTPYMALDHSKCILCRRCLNTCKNEQGLSVFGVLERGIKTSMRAVDAGKLCINCGECISACPTGALMETDDTDIVFKELMQEKEVLAAVVIPEAAVQIAGSAHDDCREDALGKTAGILRKIGFKAVYSGSEEDLLSLSDENGKYLSCCPSVLEYFGKSGSDLTGDDRASMISYFDLCRDDAAKKAGVEKEDIHLIVISPCISYKAISGKEAGYGIYVSLTGREFYQMFARICVSYFTVDDVWQHTKMSPLDTVVSAAKREEESERVWINGLENIRNAVKDTGDDREYPVMLSACGLCAN